MSVSIQLAHFNNRGQLDFALHKGENVIKASVVQFKVMGSEIDVLSEMLPDSDVLV